LKGAHLIQSFAFTDGSRCSLVLFNLSRSEALPVILSGSVAPHSAVHLSRLTSAKLTDSNEVFPLVSIKQEDLPAFDPSAPYSLPPYSMTVLSWQVSGLRFAETHRVSEQPVAHVAASASSH